MHEKGNWLLGIAIVLTIIGLVMILSTSSIVPPESKKEMWHFFLKQLLWALIGFLFIFFIVKIRLEWWNKYSLLFLIISLLSLFSTLFFPPINNARRWAFGCQPAEFVRVFFVLYLSSFFSKKQKEFERFFAPCFFLFIILSILISQSHLGMAIFFCIFILSAFILIRAKIKGILILLFILCAVMIPIIKSKPHAIKRIKERDNFQVQQARIAMGAGGLGGVGLGESMQKLSSLPLPYSDFIFAIIGEECGLFGSCILLLLFALFAYLGFSIAWHSPLTNGFFLAFLLTLSIILQTIINIGVVSGAFFTAGLPMPFISYGGSSLLSSLISVGFIINVARLK